MEKRGGQADLNTHPNPFPKPPLKQGKSSELGTILCLDFIRLLLDGRFLQSHVLWSRLNPGFEEAGFKSLGVSKWGMGLHGDFSQGFPQ